MRNVSSIHGSIFVIRAWPAFLCMSVLLIFLVVDVNQYFQYSRTGIDGYEWWRFFTAHFVHLNTNHALLNIGVFLGFCFAVGYQLKVWAWSLSIFIMALFVSAGLYFFSPEVQWYVGFSGVLHGLLILGLLLGVLRNRDIWLLMVLLVLMIKLVREQLPSFDPNLLVEWINAPVVVDAHLYGALAGFFLAVSIFCLEKFLGFNTFFGPADLVGVYSTNGASNESREI